MNKEARVRAPRLPDTGWSNARPLALQTLRGRAVLLDFFTYGCINCLNNLPLVRSFQEEYGEQLVVIGVHSGKFAREKNDDAVAEAIGRLGIGYAVVNDADGRLFEEYAVKAWPTMVLIDQNGYIVSQWSGENRGDAIQKRLEELGIAGKRERSGVRSSDPGRLRYPQKLLCSDNHLFVANTGGDSVWVCDYEGKVEDRFEGLDVPMGMAVEGRRLFVANRGSGEVVILDLQTRQRTPFLSGLRAPYDLLLQGGVLLVAMAGSHTIAAYDLQSGEERFSIGNRFEALRDGTFEAAQLAQPSSLTACGDTVWFVDAESSSLRCIENGEVKTAVGEGLFTFGDSDTGELLLQHPQGVVCGRIGDGCGGGRLFVADTYNNKVKAYDPQGKTMMTLLEGLHEPGGIAKKGCSLYIADTNAHAVIRFDLSSMKSVLFL
jgi:thiol-disulfide isomerase/thioredoxin